MCYSFIRDHAKIVRGVSYKKEVAKKEPFDGSILLLRANNILNGELNYDDCVYIPRELITPDQIVHEGDIIITMSSGSKAHVGKVAIARSDLDCTIGAFCAKIIPIDVYPKYLFFVFQSQEFRQYIESQCKGTNINNLKQSYIYGYLVNLPSNDKQQRIVARIEELFSQLDDAEATLQKTKAQLALYRQAVISSAYPDVPQEEWVRLDSIAEIIGGITKGRDLTGQKTVELPYLRVANVQNGFLDLSVMKTIELKESEKEHYLLKEGDVLYTEGGDRDKLGRGTVWHGEIPECVHQNHVFKARLQRDRALPDYVAYWSMSTYARNYFYEKGKQSVNLASINKTVLSALKLPLPLAGVQKSVIEEIEMRLSVCSSLEQTISLLIQQTAAIKQSILKYIFGKEK